MRTPWLGGTVLVGMWIFALAVFGDLPAEVPTHWNQSGEVDGWSPRMPGAFLGPGIATALLGLLLGMPYIDPRRRNVERSTEDRLLIANLLVMFLGMVEVLSLGAALGWPVDVTTGIGAGLGLLLIGMGNYLPRIRSNWWIGIRTPWTMDSERVWRDTHRIGGRAFVMGGLIMLPAAFLPSGPRGVVMLAVIASITVVTVAYSFLAWRREERPLNR